MRFLLSAAASLALIMGTGMAMAQDAPEAPAKHHHAKKHAEARAEGAGESDIHSGMQETHAGALTGERTEHGGPPSSPSEKSETDKLNDQQLGKS